MGDAPGRRPGQPLGRRVARLAATVLSLLALVGCRADVSVEVEAAAGGGGRVRATVTLDQEAAEQVPDLAEQLRVDDLEAAGWDVDGPRSTASGGSVLEVSKPFSGSAGAARALEELGGGSGFGGLRLAQERSFWRTRTTLSGAVDLSAGLGAFGDETLAERLGGPGLGLDQAAVERELGRPLADVLAFEVVADLPGRVEAASPGTRDGDRVWPVRLGATVAVRATSEAWNVGNLAAAAVAATSGMSLLVVVVRRSRRFSWG